MPTTIDAILNEYLRELKKALTGCDPALIQDALSDAEEYLRLEMENIRRSDPSVTDEGALLSIREKYGDPREVAAAYRENESRFEVSVPPHPSEVRRTRWGRFYGILADPRAWGAFLYTLMGIVTGVFYGIWGMLGLTFSLLSMILIIGLPVTALFLLSVRGIALMEGRIIEALLGVRMPRKPLFVQRDLGWSGRFKALITESFTWRALAYMILQFPLGALYSATAFVLFGFSLKCLLYPVWYLALDRPLLTIGRPIYPPGWMIPLVCLAGCVFLPATLHVVKWIAGRHGRYAKALLVRK